jgi:tRNA modification GTPase
MSVAHHITEADTIFALATAPGRAGVSVMRVSGSQASNILTRLTNSKLPKPRHAALKKIFSVHKQAIDQALVLWFPGPNSFTGEDVVEFHLHGSVAVVDALSQALFSLGLRQAEAGEFTRRAFQNGKMDLTEAEGLADLIDAQTEGQRQQALRQMQGGLRDVYEGWRSSILDSLAFVEGEIDFPDEEDVPDALAQRAGPGLDILAAELQSALAEGDRGERVRHGLDIAIIGAPNAGKSLIINRLSGRDAAIVSPEAGTTRDIVEVHVELAGLPVRISDTAGLRETDNAVEAEGVKRARKRAGEADLRLAVIDVSLRGNREVLADIDEGDIVLLNKSDLPKITGSLEHDLRGREIHKVSAETGEGFDNLVLALEGVVRTRFGAREQAGLTRMRHRECAVNALESVQKARQCLSGAPELAGAELRLALHAIKELAGESDIEAVLDRVFSSFCIGK